MQMALGGYLGIMLSKTTDNGILPMPSGITLLTTLRCTASCESCCFGCNPNSGSIFKFSDIKSILEKVSENIKSVKLVVLSGGECFLLGENLFKTIEYAKKFGYVVRCVTNAYWANNNDKAYNIISRLKDVGLDELNISTGYEHQKFVPSENVINAANNSLMAGLSTTIAIEGNDDEFSTIESIIELQINNYDKKIKKIKTLQNIWVPFINGKIKIEKENFSCISRNNKFCGCENIFNNIAISPDGSVYSCCGLSIMNIKELKLGNIFDENIEYLISRGQKDHLINWLHVDGPDIILKKLKTKFPSLHPKYGNRHQCQACASLFLDKKIKEVFSREASMINDAIIYNSFLREIISREIMYKNHNHSISKGGKNE